MMFKSLPVDGKTTSLSGVRFGAVNVLTIVVSISPFSLLPLPLIECDRIGPISHKSSPTASVMTASFSFAMRHDQMENTVDTIVAGAVLQDDQIAFGNPQWQFQDLKSILATSNLNDGVCFDSLEPDGSILDLRARILACHCHRCAQYVFVSCGDVDKEHLSSLSVD
ncbi:hypothetical protein IWX90DRAFT_445756 [Phyllosticta citrichinensis]|uniref:Uncharacterized protein n=1 Tax=Phyllosticta citrichinensis TaxID=1130410 RepID=A0ABR1XFU7_9PEZI